MRRTLAFALLTTALLISGCTATTTGAPAPAPTPVVAPAATSSAAARHVDPNHVTSTDALGDITTVSPCSLIDPKALTTYGSAEFVAADDIDDCELEFAGGAMTAAVGTLEDLSKSGVPGKVLTRTGGLRIVQDQLGSTRCEAVLIFADGVGMSSSVYATSGKGAVLCELATKLLDQVIATVTTGPGPRHRDYPAYSLAGRDACQLLTGAEVKLAGVGSLHQLGTYSAHHRCLYGVSRGTASASVELDFGERAPGWDPQWTEEQIGGSDSLVIRDPHPGAGPLTYCVVSLEWMLLDDAGPKTASETVALIVRVPGRQAPCAQAKKVAAAVWPKVS